MKLIDRYIRREILTTFAAVLLVLISILLVQRLAFYLNQVINGTLSQSAVFSLLGLQIVRFITELLPLSFLLASILAFGRLYKDSEMTAFYALGMPVKRLYRILLQVGIPLSFVVLVLNFWIVPEIAQIQEIVLKKAREEAQLTILKPGIFQKFAEGQHIVYVQRINPTTGYLENVFIKSNEANGNTAITFAKEGLQEIDENNTRFIILKEGTRTTITSEYSEVARFEVMRTRLDTTKQDNWPKAIAWSTKELFENPSPLYKRELQRRLSGSISIFLLILLIPALSHSRPRQGRFNKLIIGVIFYVFYFNLLGMGLAWMKNGTVNPDLGIWWIHILMFIVAFIVYRRYNRSL